MLFSSGSTQMKISEMKGEWNIFQWEKQHLQDSSTEITVFLLFLIFSLSFGFLGV